MDLVHMRNFKDFLLLYNHITEACFKRCMNTFISREISTNEDLCLKQCTEKHICANHTTMKIFMEVQSVITQKRIEEAQNIQTAPEAEMQKEESSEVVPM